MVCSKEATIYTFGGWRPNPVNLSDPDGGLGEGVEAWSRRLSHYGYLLCALVFSGFYL